MNLDHEFLDMKYSEKKDGKPAWLKISITPDTQLCLPGAALAISVCVASFSNIGISDEHSLFQYF